MLKIYVSVGTFFVLLKNTIVNTDKSYEKCRMAIYYLCRR